MNSLNPGTGPVAPQSPWSQHTRGHFSSLCINGCLEGFFPRNPRHTTASWLGSDNAITKILSLKVPKEDHVHHRPTRDLHSSWRSYLSNPTPGVAPLILKSCRSPETKEEQPTSLLSALCRKNLLLPAFPMSVTGLQHTGKQAQAWKLLLTSLKVREPRRCPAVPSGKGETALHGWGIRVGPSP